MATTCDAGDACFIHSGEALLLNEASALSSHTDEERQQQTCGLPRRLANKDLCCLVRNLPLSDYGPFTLSVLTLSLGTRGRLLFLLFLDLNPNAPLSPTLRYGSAPARLPSYRSLCSPVRSGRGWGGGTVHYVAMVTAAFSSSSSSFFWPKEQKINVDPQR